VNRLFGVPIVLAFAASFMIGFAGGAEEAAKAEAEAAGAEGKTQEAAPEKSEFKDQKAKTSYCIGANMGKSFRQQGLEIDAEMLARGIKDGLAGGELLLSDQEIMQTMMALRQQIMKSQSRRNTGNAQKNKKEGRAFLAENAKKEGVKALPDGVQYKVLKSGDGPSPKKTDEVIVHYRGTLIDGTEFDSSFKRGQPATFRVSGVIKGWTEVLQMMKVGDKWRVFIPGELAYAERPGPGGPFATLIFEIELLGIKGMK